MANGLNLAGRADATLVQAATQASMANVPVDLSGVFGDMAKSYAEAMGTIGEQGAALGKQLGAIAGPMINEEIKKFNYMNLTTAENIRNVGNLDDNVVLPYFEGLDKLKEMKKNYMKHDRNSDEYKKGRREFKKFQSEIFDGLDNIRSGTWANTFKLANGQLNVEANDPTALGFQSALALNGEKIPADKGYPEYMVGMHVKTVITDDNRITLGLFKGGKQVSRISPEGPVFVEDHKKTKHTVETEQDLESLATDWKGGVNYPNDKIEPGDIVKYGDKKVVFDFSYNIEDLPGIKAKQQHLVDLGYDLGNTGPKGDGVDGVWGDKSKKALKEWKDSWPDEDEPYDISERKDAIIMWEPFTGETDLKPFQVNAKEMNNLLVYKNTELRNTYGQYNLDVIKAAKKGDIYDWDTLKNDLIEGTNTGNGLADLMNARVGNLPYTYSKYLTLPNSWTKETFNSVANIMAGQLTDVTGDNKVTKADFVGAGGTENMKKLLTEMKNPSSSSAKEFFIDWYIENQKKAYNKFYKDPNKGNNEETDYFVDVKSNNPLVLSNGLGMEEKMSAGELEGIRINIEDGESFTVGTEWDFQFKDGLWILNEGEDDEQIFQSTKSMIRDGLGTNHKDFLNITEPTYKSTKKDTEDNSNFEFNEADKKRLKNLFKGKIREGKAQVVVQSILTDYPQIAKKIKHADGTSRYKLRILGSDVVYNLKDEKDANAFIAKLTQLVRKEFPAE